MSRYVAVKSEAAILGARDRLVDQCTQIINALREYGLVAAQGPSHVERKGVPTGSWPPERSRREAVDGVRMSRDRVDALRCKRYLEQAQRVIGCGHVHVSGLT
jgi:hypothetical protein